jgi:tetratricopeptide (TPR) repeat protein
MAFGFGFNKQKVLSSAEKYVQQGKLQNAITEYEKVLKADPKDLTVTNTVGDLYSRLGETDKATDCFKNVGDAYASQGFTVKAIAMYKKISKLKPSLESVLKLAELYTQQGLFNDARAQYLQVAEEFLKSGELENAVRIFQKILEMDPENVNMRVKLAEVYIRLGKKKEAWEIFTAAAETMRSKGSLGGAEEILQRMLTLDPGNSYALLMQAKNLLESGDAEAAIKSFQKIPDIDSNPDGLRDLLKAYLQTGRLSDAGTLANKLLTVHNDLTAISSFADSLMQAGQYENALQVYDQHAERLLSENSEKVLENLHIIIGHVRENPASLEKLLALFNKAGENTHISEVTELLAHASVQSGDLPRARDLYQKLAAVEPQNTLHMQNYQQVVSQLGGTSGAKLITTEEAAVIVEELEATAPSVHQHYSDEVALAVRSALTDAELFISYNMPAKALGPLVAALPQAPNDLRLNQRLAGLHTRAGRFAEAGVCCRTLQSVYSEAGYPDEATRYGELADRYEDRSSTTAATAVSEDAPIVIQAHAAQVAEEIPEAEVQVDQASIDEFSVDVDEVQIDEVQVDEAAAEKTPAHASAPWPAAKAAAASGGDAEFSVVDEHAASKEVASDEIDLSSEWDDSLTVEEGEAAHETAHAAISGAVGDHEVPDLGKLDETIDEIRFYLSHGMPDQAWAAFAKLEAKAPGHPRIAEMRAELEGAATGTPAEETAAPPMEELSAEDIPSAEIGVEEVSVELDVPALDAQDEAQDPGAQEFAVEQVIAEVEPELPVVHEVPAEIAAPPIAPAPAASVPAAPVTVAPAAVEIPVVAEPEIPKVAAKVEAAPAAKVETKIEAAAPPVPPPAPKPAVQQPAVHQQVQPEVAAEVEAEEVQPGVLQDFVSDLESSLGDSFLPGAVAHEEPAAYAPKIPATSPAVPAVAHAAAAAQQGAVLGEFVADLESTLGDDFLNAAPVPTSSPAAISAVSPVQIPAPAPPAAAPMVASAAAAGAAPAVHTAPPAPPQPTVQPGSIRTPQPPKPPAAPAAAKASPFGEEAGVDLAEMFGELKQDLEADVASADEDPETHYNLGIAFREMGLLDEAIGELQKTCQAVDRGHPFPQIMQTYTWLAQCFLDKGVPEAAVRWYEKALAVPTIDGEARVALNYELAAAHEAAGNKPAALKHFLEVYGSNIDYRDVAERIKALKS